MIIPYRKALWKKKGYSEKVTESSRILIETQIKQYEFE